MREAASHRGDLVALIIREEDFSGTDLDRERITFYAGEARDGDDNPGSCTELVESVGSLDGGFFNDVIGYDIETGEGTLNP